MCLHVYFSWKVGEHLDEKYAVGKMIKVSLDERCLRDLEEQKQAKAW